MAKQNKLNSILTIIRDTLKTKFKPILDLTRSSVVGEIVQDQIDKYETRKSISKIDLLKQQLKTFGNDPDEIMSLIMNTFDKTDEIPIPGQIYTFLYYAKTPKIIYDQHPLSIITEITETGFKGFNVHLNKVRQYNFDCVDSPFHRIQRGEEFDYLNTLPYKKILLNS
jgi:hypothetical protein